MGVGPGPQERFAIQFVDGCFNETSSGEWMGASASMALDPNTNAVNLSYYDSSDANLRYAYKADNSNVWYTMSIDGSSGTDVGFYTSIVVDNQGNRHISYFDNSNSDLKYAYGVSGGQGGSGYGISWEIYKVDTEGYTGDSTSIAVDTSINPHICYWDSSEERVKYAYGPFDTQGQDISWQIYNVDSMQYGNSLKISLSLDSLGNRHICYANGQENINNIRYAFGPSGNSHSDISWQIYNVDISGSYQQSSLAIDSSGNRHISYFDAGLNSDLKYAFGPAGSPGQDISWNIYTIDTSGSVGNNTSIAVNPNNNIPSIKYYKSSVTGISNNELRIATQSTESNTSWKISVLDSSLNFFYDNGNSQIKIDEIDSTHLCYHDVYVDIFDPNHTPIGRLRYAKSPPETYGDYCPFIDPLIREVSFQLFTSEPSFNGFLDFSTNRFSSSQQKPFLFISHDVSECTQS